MNIPGLVHTRDAATIHFFGTRMRILVSGAQTAGAFCVIEVNASPGHTTPVHVHHRETETVHVLEGSITAVVDGQHVEIVPGDTAVLPPNVQHQLITGPHNTRSLLFCTPAGFDQYVETIGTSVPVPPDAASMARAVAVAAQFGIDIQTK